LNLPPIHPSTRDSAAGASALSQHKKSTYIHTSGTCMRARSHPVVVSYLVCRTIDGKIGGQEVLVDQPFNRPQQPNVPTGSMTCSHPARCAPLPRCYQEYNVRVCPIGRWGGYHVTQPPPVPPFRPAAHGRNLKRYLVCKHATHDMSVPAPVSSTMSVPIRLTQGRRKDDEESGCATRVGGWARVHALPCMPSGRG